MASSLDISQIVEQACRRIAPSWPLDQAIAVNPYVGFLDMSMRKAAHLLHFVAGMPLLMKQDWYQSASIAESMPTTMRCFSDVVDEYHIGGALRCRNIVTNSISQLCASYFDHTQAQWQPQRTCSLYQSWRRRLSHDPGPSMLSGIPNIAKHASELPDNADTTIARALEILQIPIHLTEEYLLCLLFRINGWASWCAYLDRIDDGFLQRKELLAIYISYELVLFQCVTNPTITSAWTREQESWKQFQREPSTDSRWTLQEKIESAYRSGVHTLLLAPGVIPTVRKPQVQAIFCIDVRSEVYRRALESVHTSVETLGSAGFFGLPMAYLPVGSDHARAQVVPLIKPRYNVKDDRVTSADTEKRRARLSLRRIFSEWKRSSISKFSFVESLGIFFAFAMLANMKDPHRPTKSDYVEMHHPASRNPRVVGLEHREATTLAESILRGMSLIRSFAPIVCIIGHESCTTNNPQASSLDCGACGGQSGEINAQAVAELLNRPAVRLGLIERGIEIPEETWFFAGIHDTSNDEVRVHTDHVPQRLRAKLTEFESMLSLAGSRAREERKTTSAILPYHWANVRPEWGLARNAAILIAPRSRTYGKPLDGRAFLQEYNHTEDADGSILRGILGGPLVVAHWISLQYYASTVDPEHFSSGNKLLHNIVGGAIGVFEGNSGDLRIGISRQALYDGQQLIHTPLRLAAWIESPRDRVGREILNNHMLCQMISGDWITVFNLDPNHETIHQAILVSDDGESYDLRWQATTLSRSTLQCN